MPAIGLTLRLAGVVTLVLLLLGTPIAWWLARTHSRWRGVIGALVALPLVLPPSVLGFYVLLAMGPNGPLGHVTAFLEIAPLAFTFPGLVNANSAIRSEEHTSELQSLMRISYAVLCLKKKNISTTQYSACD